MLISSLVLKEQNGNNLIASFEDVPHNYQFIKDLMGATLIGSVKDWEIFAGDCDEENDDPWYVRVTTNYAKPFYAQERFLRVASKEEAFRLADIFMSQFRAVINTDPKFPDLGVAVEKAARIRRWYFWENGKLQTRDFIEKPYLDGPSDW